MGGAFAEKALAAGANLFLTYFEHGDEVKKLAEKGAATFRVDLSDMRAIEQFSAHLKEKIPTLDVLIHNAAAIRDHTIENMTEEDWDRVMTVDLKAPYYLTKELMPLLFKASRQGRGAKIFFMTSRVALQGGFGVSNYAAAKAGLIGLTKSLAAELGKKQILVNAINPGFMKSRMTENLPERVFQKNLEASPLARDSNPEEVADFLITLCSDWMTQVTGQVFHFESRRMN